jgi:hypothetical protein
MSVVIMSYVLHVVQGIRETKVNKPLYKNIETGSGYWQFPCSGSSSVN